MVPLVSLSIWLAQLLVPDQAVRDFFEQLAVGMNIEGEASAGFVDEIGRTSAQTGLGLIGFGSLLFAAAVVVSALQDAFDEIWELPVARGIWNKVRRRLKAFLIVGGGGIVIVLTLVINAVSGLLKRLLPGESSVLDRIPDLFSFVSGWVLLIGGLAVVFQVLTRERINVITVGIGSSTTAALLVDRDATPQLVPHPVRQHIAERSGQLGLLGAGLAVLRGSGDPHRWSSDPRARRATHEPEAAALLELMLLAGAGYQSAADYADMFTPTVRWSMKGGWLKLTEGKLNDSRAPSLEHREAQLGRTRPSHVAPPAGLLGSRVLGRGTTPCAQLGRDSPPSRGRTGGDSCGGMVQRGSRHGVEEMHAVAAEADVQHGPDPRRWPGDGAGQLFSGDRAHHDGGRVADQLGRHDLDTEAVFPGHSELDVLGAYADDDRQIAERIEQRRPHLDRSSGQLEHSLAGVDPNDRRQQIHRRLAEERRNISGGGALVDVDRRADLLDLAVDHHGDPVAHHHGVLLAGG